MAKVLREKFPIVYEAGKAQAVIVDVETFDRIIRTLERLQQLADSPEETRWIFEVVEQARAYRAAHPEEAMTYESPEAVLEALNRTEPE
ncbi:MAG TPA: hypothetical protein VJG32_02530 [Anaerolineae bacterium]|nr:hypothetical protein [Anaerolineae bacterium]